MTLCEKPSQLLGDSMLQTQGFFGSNLKYRFKISRKFNV